MFVNVIDVCVSWRLFTMLYRNWSWPIAIRPSTLLSLTLIKKEFAGSNEDKKVLRCKTNEKQLIACYKLGTVSSSTIAAFKMNNLLVGKVLPP